ncbi:Bacterial non-heme ferritin [Desulfonema limicola]|uniref:Ferritin n=1 Tax=Desulfonema limicola TaxID=45656 RepID=A0A975GJZ1_9BACT|nr:ferritin [Desulfonema limicola]QTA83970.1 Bacterial non-heme ferritin [Desulfonema limicola]
MLSKKMEDALNDQINAELYSAYLYMSMSAYFEAEGLNGFAQWMKAQAQEEQLHAEKFYSYINERDGRVILKAVDAPPFKWDSALAVFKDILAHEQKVTGLINHLVDLAIEQKDHAAHQFLQWFVEEQVEEESSVRSVIDELNLIGGGGSGMFMLNRELGQRVFAQDTAE